MGPGKWGQWSALEASRRDWDEECQGEVGAVGSGFRMVLGSEFVDLTKEECQKETGWWNLVTGAGKNKRVHCRNG